MIEILVDNDAICLKVERYIQRHILAYGYCSVDDVAKLNGVHAVNVSEIGWPLRRIGWVEMPEITFRKDSIEDFWRIQIDDPVLLSLERVKAAKDVKTIHKEDMVDVMAYSGWMEEVIGKAFNDLQKEGFCKRFEHPLTPKSIEQSADHKTVCVLWQDGSKTIVKLSENDKDDIDTAFAYALAKKIFGTNTHLKKVVREKLNVHKPKVKALPSDPNPKEIPVDFKYIKAAKELFLQSHILYDVQIGIDAVNTVETRVHMYNSREGIIEYMKDVESTQEALSKMESMWMRFTTKKED